MCNACFAVVAGPSEEERERLHREEKQLNRSGTVYFFVDLPDAFYLFLRLLLLNLFLSVVHAPSSLYTRGLVQLPKVYLHRHYK